jgi:hypothetical protein
MTSAQIALLLATADTVTSLANAAGDTVTTQDLRRKTEAECHEMSDEVTRAVTRQEAPIFDPLRR